MELQGGNAESRRSISPTEKRNRGNGNWNRDGCNRCPRLKLFEKCEKLFPEKVCHDFDVNVPKLELGNDERVGVCHGFTLLTFPGWSLGTMRNLFVS